MVKISNCDEWLYCYLNFHPLEIVSRDPQLQVEEIHPFSFNWEQIFLNPDI